MNRGYPGQKRQLTQPANTTSAHVKGNKVRILLPVTYVSIITHATQQSTASGGLAKLNSQTRDPLYFYNDPNLKPPANNKLPSFKSFPPKTVSRISSCTICHSHLQCQTFHCEDPRPDGKDIFIDSGKAESDIHAAGVFEGASGYPKRYYNYSGQKSLIKAGNEPNVELMEVPVTSDGPPYNCDQRRRKVPPARAIYTKNNKDFVGVVYHPVGAPSGEHVPATVWLGGHVFLSLHSNVYWLNSEQAS